jgi:hypothetical protein
LPTIRSEAVRPLGPWSIALNFAGVVRSVVGTAATFIDSLLRVWAKGASHVDDATFVDSGGGDRFWGLVLFAPAFERSQLIELIGAGPSPAMIHPGDHKKTKPVVLVRAHVFQDRLVIRDGIQGGDRAVGTSVAPTVIHEELAPACFEFRQVRVDGVDLFSVQKCSVDVLFQVEAAPILCGVLIGNIAEDVDVHGPGLGAPDNPSVATFASNIGQILKTRGDLEAALSYTERALKILQNSYGSDNPITKKVAANLERIKQAQQR